MARPNSIPMGAAAVGIGAFGARHVANAAGGGLALRLALGTALTSITTAGSMLMNDYHDHREGVDTPLTKPGRPLVTGEVRPATVKFVLKWAYAVHLCLLCLLDSALMRMWVLGNTLMTYLYSVHLKPITGLKNVVCAFIVSMAVGLGAGAGLEALKSVWRPMACVAGLIWHREILMDIKDLDGDASVGLKTLPVVFGRDDALLASLLPLALATGAAVTSRPAMLATAPLLLQARAALQAKHTNFQQPALSRAIERAPLYLLITLIALTAL